MHFASLKLRGFKSFVDPAELLVEPGLTGIVGPNGCGKSNLVEALRWIMGESSASKMRAAGMDDVIFSGTRLRPPHNVAEVALRITNTSRDAPAAWNDSDEIQVVRRIERSTGSSYSINGQDARARDVRLFFSDVASGARSVSMVSQGQVASLLNAKPQARRQLLEEAAGIVGLQSRRHEADLKLNGAEANLERLADIIAEIETQQANLQRQSRQAMRYRQVSERIRNLLAQLLLRRWLDATEDHERENAALNELETEIVTSTQQVAHENAILLNAQESLKNEEEVLARVDRAVGDLRLERVSLDAERRHYHEQKTSSESQLAQLGDDLAKGRSLISDVVKDLENLDNEETEIRCSEETYAREQSDTLEQVDQLERIVTRVETDVIAKSEQRAVHFARQEAMEMRRLDLESRDSRLELEMAVLKESNNADENESDVEFVLESLQKECSEAAYDLDQARESLGTTQEIHSINQNRAEVARVNLRRAESAVSRLQAEYDALAALAAGHRTEQDAPILDLVAVRSGYEKALGAAFGDELDASTEPGGPATWTGADPLDRPSPLPGDLPALASFVTAPPELSRRLSQTAVVPDHDGDRLASGLEPGQRLVSCEGRMWRWDGYVVHDMDSTVATRIAMRARLETLASDVKVAHDAQETCKTGLARIESELDDTYRQVQLAQASVETGTQSLQNAQDKLRDTSSNFDTLRLQRQNRKSRLDQLESERRELRTELESLRSELEKQEVLIPESELVSARKLLVDERARLSRTRSTLDRVQRTIEENHARLREIAALRTSRTQNHGELTLWVEELDARRCELETTLVRLQKLPQALETRAADLDLRTMESERTLRDARDSVARAQGKLAESTRSLRACESTLAGLRERRASAEVLTAQAKFATDEGANVIESQLGLQPHELVKTIPDIENLATAVHLQTQHDRATRERDNIGAVNLLAQSEAEELELRLRALYAERDELEEAIQRLRRSLHDLNREGRQRLRAAFTTIDDHFQKLNAFFLGGSSRLVLTDSDDPLEAGLDIEVNPSGKDVMRLSLLSGGEKSAASLSLLFALFLTNPAPICVLDEVDDSLDDANVGRFCDLLDELSKSGRSRFLVISHKIQTMARMDRLYGVTMGEPGVSQLLSVDLSGTDHLQLAA